MTTITLNPIVAEPNRKGMDEYDIEAERQGSALRGINVLRPAKSFFKKIQKAIPTTVAIKM